MKHHVLTGTDAASLGRTNYTGVAGMWGRCQKGPGPSFEGMLTNRSDLTLGKVTVMDAS